MLGVEPVILWVFLSRPAIIPFDLGDSPISRIVDHEANIIGDTPKVLVPPLLEVAR